MDLLPIIRELRAAYKLQSEHLLEIAECIVYLIRNNLNKLTSCMSHWRSTRRSTRGEQPGEGVEVDEKNDQIALRRIVL